MSLSAGVVTLIAMSAKVTVRSRVTNAALVVVALLFALVAFVAGAVVAPQAFWVVRVMWLLFVLGVTTFVSIRIVRRGVSAGASGLTVHKLWRDIVIAWSDVVSIETRTVGLEGDPAIVIRRADGSRLIGLSSLSSRAVHRWRNELAEVQKRYA